MTLYHKLLPDWSAVVDSPTVPKPLSSGYTTILPEWGAVVDDPEIPDFTRTIYSTPASPAMKATNAPATTPATPDLPDTVSHPTIQQRIGKIPFRKAAGITALGLGSLYAGDKILNDVAPYAVDQYKQDREFDRSMEQARQYQEVADYRNAADHERFLDMYERELNRQMMFAGLQASQQRYQQTAPMIAQAYGVR